MTAITRELARFVAGLSYDALPAEVRERVKALALDLVGIMLRARNDAESTPADGLRRRPPRPGGRRLHGHRRRARAIRRPARRC